MLSMETLALARAYADKIKQQVGAGFTPKIVESLPATGDSKILYLVLKEGTAPQGNIYDEYLWIGSAYEHIGDTSTLITVDSALSATSENPVQNKAIKAELDNKVDKITGKGLSTNDYTNEEKAEVAKVSGKVDKVSGKGLSTNDYTNEEKAEVAKVSNKLDKPTSNGGVLYINSFDQPSIKSIASSVTTSDTSELATVKIVKDYINSLDASEVSY